MTQKEIDRLREGIKYFLLYGRNSLQNLVMLENSWRRGRMSEITTFEQFWEEISKETLREYQDEPFWKHLTNIAKQSWNAATKIQQFHISTLEEKVKEVTQERDLTYQDVVKLENQIVPLEIKIRELTTKFADEHELAEYAKFKYEQVKTRMKELESKRKEEV
jgi:chromosome segregation ATPase